MSVILKRQYKTLLASSARSAGSAVASASVDSKFFNKVSGLLDLTAVTGSPDSYTLDVKFQGSPDSTDVLDASSNWFDITSGSFTQLTATGSEMITGKVIDCYMKIRVVYTLAFVNGTTPKATFSVIAMMGQI